MRKARPRCLEVWVEGDRLELDAAPSSDVTGKWAIGGKTLTLTDDGGTWGDTELANIDRAGDAVSFTVADEGGVSTVSLVLIDEALRGTVALPDGSRQTVTAQRTGDAEATEASEPDVVEAAPAVDDASAKEAADGVPTELQTGDGEPGTATPGETAKPEDTSESPASPDREGGVLERTPTTRPTTSTTQPTTTSLTVGARPDEAPLFEVNYPLGAYGLQESEVGVNAATESGGDADFQFAGFTVWTNGPLRCSRARYDEVKDGKWLQRRPVQGGRATLAFCRNEGDNLHITPGLIDAHSHIATDGGINEGTQAVTCEVRIGDFIDPDDIHLYRQLAGGVTTAQILHGSANPIGGQSQVIKFRWGQGPDALKFEDAPLGVKWALGENVKQANWGDGFNTRYPQTRMGVQEIFKDSLRAAVAYKQAKADFEAEGGMPVRTDLELEALVEMLDGDRIIHCHSYRQDEILATMRTLEKFDVVMKCFTHILEGYKVAPEMKKHGAMASAFSDWWAYKFEVYDAIPYAGSIMHDAGIVVSFNSDDAELATRLNTEAAKAVKYGGVSEVEALKFVTLNPAIQLGIDDRVGSLEPGKDADFVVWSGHPLDSTSVVEQTWVDGIKVFDRQEHQAAMQRNAEMKAALIQKVLGSGETPAKPGENDPRPGTLWPRHDLYCHDHGHVGHDH